MTIAQLKQDIDRRFDAVDARFAGVDARFAGIDARFADLESRLQAGFADAKRHMTMLYESLHDDLRLFADAIRTNTERLDGHERRIRRLESGRRR